MTQSGGATAVAGNTMIFKRYYDADTDTIYSIMDVYLEYLRERTNGNALAEDFGEFLRWIDCYGMEEES